MERASGTEGKEPAGTASALTDARLHTVRARDVSKLFGATPALRSANITLKSKVPLLLSGPNGAGKSTLLGILGTHLRPTRGEVLYLTEDRRALDKREVRSRLGWVSHHSHCYGELSGKDNVLLAARLQGAPDEAYDEVAERVGLGAFALRPVRTLSRGQTQRVALARALVHRPELLLLDEPWTGLDKSSGELLYRVVLEEKARGTLIAVVSHEPEIAERLGATVIQVVRGKTEDPR